MVDESMPSQEILSPEWHTDRSRYMTGFECAWKRLLKYHAFGTGLTPEIEALPLTVGISVHKTLEKMLNLRVLNPEGQHFDPAVVDSLLQGGWTIPASPQSPDFLLDARDISIAIPHAYARIIMPWLNDNFTIFQVEKELSWRHNTRLKRTPTSYHSEYDEESTQEERLEQLGRLTELRRLIFNSRPDFIATDKSTNKLTVHDFKTASSFQESRELMTYADNVQMMINSFQVKEDNNLQYYPDYYVHILLKGNNWSPSPFVHAYHRLGAPPMQREDWQPKYWLGPAVPGGKKRSLGKAYSKQRVSDLRPISEWVWEMDPAIAAQQIIILGPFNVISEKVSQFMRGLPTNEEEWFRRLDEVKDWTQWADSDFQMRLDRHFPRTFNCYTYGQRCSMYNLCFKGPGWDKPFDHGFVERQPHHVQEPKGELIR